MMLSARLMSTLGTGLVELRRRARRRAGPHGADAEPAGRDGQTRRAGDWGTRGGVAVWSWSDLCEMWGLWFAGGRATKDCNRLCDRAVTIRLTTMCHLTDFMVPEEHHSQRRHAALCGTG